MTPATLPRGLIWSGLIAAALLHLGFNLLIGLEADDTENLETTRVLAAARQFTDGPAALYGPYSGANPCVLIQAPLYYRLTALGAGPFVASGVDPIRACFIAGRGISLLSFLGILILGYKAARLGGLPWQAGALTAILLLGTPMFGSYPVTMRPDMLGVLLQSLGVFGVVVAVVGCRWRGPVLIASYLAFALALATKQHYIGGVFCSSILLAAAWWNGRLPLAPIVLAHLGALLTLAGYYGIEELATGGAMSRAVFVLPGDLGRVTTGASSSSILLSGVFLETFKRSAGLLALAVAILWALRDRLATRPYEVGILLFTGLELALMAKLCLNSSGAWFNYGLQAAVCLAVLLGRGLASATAPGMAARRLVPVALAALLLLAGDVRMIGQGYRDRQQVQAEYREILADARVAGLPTDARYFPGHLQHYNVRAGCGPLTHDEWLYHAFEAIDEAEPRERWLRHALVDGPVRMVIAEPTADAVPGTIPGLGEPLTALGFEPAGSVGRLSLWQRR